MIYRSFQGVSEREHQHGTTRTLDSFPRHFSTLPLPPGQANTEHDFASGFALGNTNSEEPSVPKSAIAILRAHRAMRCANHKGMSTVTENSLHNARSITGTEIGRLRNDCQKDLPPELRLIRDQNSVFRTVYPTAYQYCRQDHLAYNPYMKPAYYPYYQAQPYFDNDSIKPHHKKKKKITVKLRKRKKSKTKRLRGHENYGLARVTKSKSKKRKFKKISKTQMAEYRKDLKAKKKAKKQQKRIQKKRKLLRYRARLLAKLTAFDNKIYECARAASKTCQTLLHIMCPILGITSIILGLLTGAEAGSVLLVTGIFLLGVCLCLLAVRIVRCIDVARQQRQHVKRERKKWTFLSQSDGNISTLA